MSNGNREQRIDPDAAFERDVPEAMREDLYQTMAEATANGEGSGDVSICEHDRIDMINCRASGIVRIGDREFAFEMEDGNSRGTVLLHWGEEERPFVRHEPTRWAVQPNGDVVAKALEAGRGAFLLLKWDAMASRSDVTEIVRAYGYDRYFAPGLVTETHWRGKAAKMGFAIVDEETAAETRRMLAG